MKRLRGDKSTVALNVVHLWGYGVWKGEGCWFSSISIYESNSEKEQPLLLCV